MILLDTSNHPFLLSFVLRLNRQVTSSYKLILLVEAGTCGRKGGIVFTGDPCKMYGPHSWTPFL